MPRSDVCDDCTILRQQINSTTSPVKKNDLLAELLFHQSEAKCAFLIQNYFTEICKILPASIHFSFDFQADLHLPKMADEPTMLYRLKKMNVRNFGIADHISKEMTCFIYNELIGGKGSNEVMSLLVQYFMCQIKQGKAVFFLSCDNCGKENKNKALFLLLYFISKQFGVVIFLMYHVKGHTYMLNDTMFSQISRKMIGKNFYTDNDIHQFIYDPQNFEQCRNLISDFNKNNNCIDSGSNCNNGSISIGNNQSQVQPKSITATFKEPVICPTKFTLGHLNFLIGKFI